MRPTKGVFSRQSLLWVPRAFPVYKFGYWSSSKAESKGACIFIQQFLPGFGGGLLLGVLFLCYFWPSHLGQMPLHCFKESYKVRRSRYKQLEVNQQALKYGSWGRRTEYWEGLLLNTLYLTLHLPSTFGLKWALADFKHHKPETSPNGDSPQLLKMLRGWGNGNTLVCSYGSWKEGR